jgi:hypothetical protein
MAKRMNQLPTGQGKKQSPRSGGQHKLEKRSEVLQAAGARQNIGTADDEEAGPMRANPKRTKAGR